MPPAPAQYQGRATIARFLSTVPAGGRLERYRLVATRANGQPAFGFYLKDPQCPIARATGLMVLTLAGDAIAAITAFHDTSVFPLTWPALHTAPVAPPARRRHGQTTTVRPLADV